MIILRNDKVLVLLLCLLILSCSATKRIEKDLKSSEVEETYFKGISVVNAETGESILDFNGGKYFTPASNVKLFTLYAGWRTLGDSISSFDYVKSGDSLLIRGAANPLFLTDSLSEKALDFLRGSRMNLYLIDDAIQEEVYGVGWTWEDYPYSYMPEKHLFPIYGNLITMSKNGDRVEVHPDFFKDHVQITDSTSMVRSKEANEFYVKRAANFSEKQVPFITSNQLVADLLSNELDKKVILVPHDKQYDFKSFKEVPYDTLYTRMMVNSDNFMAEQLMLQVGNKSEGIYSVKKAIKYTMEHYLPDIPQQPRWVDGSGLSRYNLFSPRSMTYLLKRMFDEMPHEKLFSYLPKGGLNGTLKNHFTDQPYIQAKSGSLSNNYALSGYLTTKKGQVLIFSYMNNHFQDSSSERKKEMSVFFKNLYESY